MSAFLLDTNVISELIKPRPEPRVVAWIEETNESLLYLSVLTLGEIRRAWPRCRRLGVAQRWRLGWTEICVHVFTVAS